MGALTYRQISTAYYGLLCLKAMGAKGSIHEVYEVAGRLCSILQGVYLIL